MPFFVGLAVAGVAAVVAIIAGGVAVVRHRQAGLLRRMADSTTAELNTTQKALERLEAVLQYLPRAIVVAEVPGGRLILANEREVERVTRHPLRYDQGVDAYVRWTGWHADGRPVEAHEWPLARAVQKGDITHDIQLQYQFGDGKRGWLSISAAPVRDPRGQIIAAVAMFSDITERKWMEELLQQSEERYRTLLNMTATIVWTAAPDGRLLADVPEWEAFTGQTPRQYKQMGWIEAIHPDDRAQAVADWQRHIADRAPMRLTFRLRRRDGVYRHMTLRGVPMFEDESLEQGAPPEGRSVREWFGTCIDVDERRRAERDQEELEQHKTDMLKRERAARSEAERVSRMKDEFLATLSHELRTPLNAILGWSQILQEPHLSAEELQQGLEVIERNTRIQAKLIEDLLDLSRIISGKLRLDVRPLDLPAVIEAAIESVRPAADAKQIELIAQFDGRVGAISGDSARLQQVVWNLLSNAVKFTPRGGCVRITLRRNGSSVEIEVADNGSGIPAQVLPYVFERFRQGDSSSTRRHGGLGLGLSIVKQLVETHGGTVAAHSGGENQGAVFTVHLPLLAVRAEALALPTPGSSSRVDVTGIRVLVVDDEADAREMVQRVLERGGATVHTAANADEAVEMLRRHRPDVLLSDIGMPHRDGFDLIRQVRALPADDGGEVPAAALTAFARADDRRRALSCGYHAHLSKPIEPAELLNAVARLGGR